LVSVSVSEAETSSLPASEPQVEKRARKATQPSLGINTALRDTARELRDLHWRLVEDGGFKISVGKTLWGKRNNATALALAEQGVTPEKYESAWRSLQKKLGEPPREMSLVARHLDTLATPSGETPSERYMRVQGLR
jgi:hypothetical protein